MSNEMSQAQISGKSKISRDSFLLGDFFLQQVKMKIIHLMTHEIEIDYLLYPQSYLFSNFLYNFSLKYLFFKSHLLIILFCHVVTLKQFCHTIYPSVCFLFVTTHLILK